MAEPTPPGNAPIAGVAAAAPGGVGLFLCCFGPAILDPTRIGWTLAAADTSMNHIGWMFFRQEPWIWPPRAIRQYLAPMGASIFLTDSIPLLALPLKSISGLLPPTFQYLGFWMLLNCVLQSIFRCLIVRLFRGGAFATAAGTLLILASPVFMVRQGGHIALASHWLLLWGLWLYLRPERAPRGVGRGALPWLGLVLVASLVHAYLTVMVLGMAGAYVARRCLIDRDTGLAASFAIALALVGALLVRSAGFAGGAPASIRLGDVEYSLMGQGINAVVLDSTGCVESLATFDTVHGAAGAILTPVRE